MENISALLSGILIASALLTFFIFVYAFRLNNPGAKTFSFLCLANAFYSFGYAMEIYSAGFNQMLLWNAVQYIGLPFLPAFWIVFAIQYSGKEYLLKPFVKSGIFIIPVITLILRYTSNLNHLYYANVQYNSNYLFPVLFIEKGPWYLVHGIYMSACVIYGNYLYLLQYKKSTGTIRRQSLIMFTASLFPWLAYFPDLLNIAPFGIDYGPFATTLSCLLFLIALLKYQLLNLKPLAREKVFASTNDGIIVLDDNYRIIDFNLSAVAVFPVLQENVISQNVQMVLGTNDKLVDSILNFREIQYESANDNIKNYYNVKTVKILNRKNWVLGFIVTITNITKYVESMEKLSFLASRDALTGVYNRRYFVELGSRELIRASRYKHALSFIILDLDFFKNINDHFGHQAGDAVLKAVAGICQKSIRSIDIIGRFGGEEFVIFLPETRLEECEVIANRILMNIETAEILYDEEFIKVTVSMGITGTNSVINESLDYFLKKADQALYQAKSDGRNCVRSTELEPDISVSSLH